MENTYKTLWEAKHGQFVHFEFSPLADEVHWGHSSMPQLMSPEADMEILFRILPENTILPEGTEMKTVKLIFVEDEKNDSVS
jgi:hypothetical protein